MINDQGDMPEFDAHCSGGLCGPINYDFIFQRAQAALDAKLDDEATFQDLRLKAGENINTGNLTAARYLFREAYQLALDTESLGIDACFDVMFELHYFNLDDDSFAMCKEMSELAFQTKNISILRDIWLLLPEIGSGRDLQQVSLTLRDEIESRHPEVMTYSEKSGRL